MANVTLPEPNSDFSEEVIINGIRRSKINSVWFRKLSELLNRVNTNNSDIEAIKADIIAIKAFVGMP